MHFNMTLAVAGLIRYLPSNRGLLNLGNTRSLVHFWTYRVGSYALLNFVDDPAWLALMFC